MLLLYAADIHGSEQVWRKFVNAAKYFSVDTLILGGDITGKILVPLVEDMPGRYAAQVYGKVEKVTGQEGIAKLEKKLRFNGYYTYRCSPEEYQIIATDRDYRMNLMRREMVETVNRWVQIADEKLTGTTAHIYAMAGNDDEFIVDDALRGVHLTNVEGKVVEIGDYQLLSSAWGNPSPWNTPREKEEAALFDLFEGLASQLEDGIPAIFNLHIPPYDSGLDTGPEITGMDEHGQAIVKIAGGMLQQCPVGSTSVRKLIEKYQPVLGLHSHIHESKKAVHIGATLCVNPGSNYQDGVLDACLVELGGKKVLRHQFVSG